MKIAGLDIGTTGCKLTVFDDSGAYLGHIYQDYPVKRGSSGHEVEVEMVMEGILSVMKAVGEKHPDIAGIGVTSFGETFVLADGKGRPLHPAMLFIPTQEERKNAENWKKNWAVCILLRSRDYVPMKCIVFRRSCG